MKLNYSGSTRSASDAVFPRETKTEPLLEFCWKLDLNHQKNNNNYNYNFTKFRPRNAQSSKRAEFLDAGCAIIFDTCKVNELSQSVRQSVSQSYRL